MADSSSTAQIVPLFKARIIGEDREEVTKAERTSDESPSNDTFSAAWKESFVEPPYDLSYLCKVHEQASSLRPNIDAYKTNIDGFGHVFVPYVQLRDSGARDIVADAIFIERYQKHQSGSPSTLTDLLPPDEKEIEKKIRDIQYVMRIEKARIESFFDNCVADESFVSLRRRTREDLEATGNAYWEAIRNDAGELAQFAYMPSRSVRVLKKKSRMLGVVQQVRVGTLAFRSETFKRTFKRYIQIGGDRVVYFKEFGDPSFVSGKSGVEYPSVAEMKKEEGEDAELANEIFHFKIHSLTNGSYGVPRWMGNLLSVLGSRSAEEVNFAYFENKSIPPMAILVSGGRLGEESVKRIQDFVEIQIKGKKNFHKILVIEAETSAGAIGIGDSAGSMRIEIKQLTDAQLKDGLFLAYDAANIDKVGMGFRIPRLLRGDIRDFNRASAEAALQFAESQVFVPERNDFDFIMNRFVLTSLGIKLWKFQSNGPRISDAEAWGEMTAKLAIAGILTPADGREIVGKKVLEHDLPAIDADWPKQPIALTIAGVRADAKNDGIIPMEGIPDAADPARLTAPTEPGTTKPNLTLVKVAKQRLLAKARELLNLRDAFMAEEMTAVVKRFQKARAEEEPNEIVFKMTPQEIAERFGIEPK